MPGRGLRLERLAFDRMDAAARVYRTAYDASFPHLAGRRSPQQDTSYFREQVFPAEQVWGALIGEELCGIVSFREGWVEKLYVLPARHGQGLGKALLAIAKRANRRLQVWTWACNVPGRRFYETQGFVLVREGDGSDNEEGEPDVLYAWARE